MLEFQNLVIRVSLILFELQYLEFGINFYAYFLIQLNLKEEVYVK